jgi:hypothetical protein
VATVVTTVVEPPLEASPPLPPRPEPSLFISDGIEPESLVVLDSEADEEVVAEILRFKLHLRVLGKSRSSRDKWEASKAWQVALEEDYNDLGAIILVQDWWQEAISERPTVWEVKRIEAVADYSGCSKRDRYYSDLAVRIVLHDWKALVGEILVSWMKDKHHSIAVSLIVHCEAALAAPEPTAPAIQAPEPSQVVNANLVTPVAPLRGRISC